MDWQFFALAIPVWIILALIAVVGWYLAPALIRFVEGARCPICENEADAQLFEEKRLEALKYYAQWKPRGV